MERATRKDDDGTGYCRGCGTTIGEPHHSDCALPISTDQACINIYMSLHVSQLDAVSKQVKDAWIAGQNIYHSR